MSQSGLEYLRVSFCSSLICRTAVQQDDFEQLRQESCETEMWITFSGQIEGNPDRHDYIGDWRYLSLQGFIPNFRAAGLSKLLIENIAMLRINYFTNSLVLSGIAMTSECIKTVVSQGDRSRPRNPCGICYQSGVIPVQKLRTCELLCNFNPGVCASWKLTRAIRSLVGSVGKVGRGAELCCDLPGAGRFS